MNTQNVLDDIEELHGEFINILSSISLLKTSLTELQNNIKNLEKNTNKKMKTYSKIFKKMKRNGTKTPSGFAKPSKISKELCQFMNKPDGTHIARTEVTQYIIKYIKEHKLQDDKDKRIIQADEKLLNLLKLSDKEELNYFNLQSYMNKHFV